VLKQSTLQAVSIVVPHQRKTESFLIKELETELSQSCIEEHSLRQVCMHSLHLVGHQQVCVVALLVAGFLEKLGKARQTNVVAVKVAVQRVVHVAHVVLHAAHEGAGQNARCWATEKSKPGAFFFPEAHCTQART